MKLPLIIIGIVLIAVGLVSLAYQGITYTSRETVLEVGPIKASADKESEFPCRRFSGASPSRAASRFSSARGAADDRGRLTPLLRSLLRTLSVRCPHA